MIPSLQVFRTTPKRLPANHTVEMKKPEKEMVIVTGISGAGKASALRSFEDLG